MLNPQVSLKTCQQQPGPVWECDVVVLRHLKVLLLLNTWLFSGYNYESSLNKMMSNEDTMKLVWSSNIASLTKWQRLTPPSSYLHPFAAGDMSHIDSVCNLCWTQTDQVDVNVPNSDGATAVMLAVRDIDLFEGLTAWLPWEHRPVEVIKELLEASA